MTVLAGVDPDIYKTMVKKYNFEKIKNQLQRLMQKNRNSVEHTLLLALSSTGGRVSEKKKFVKENRRGV